MWCGALMGLAAMLLALTQSAAAASFITNATCAFSPTVASGLTATPLTLVNMIPSGLCGRVALGDSATFSVSPIDLNLASYTVSGTVTISITQYLTTSLIASDLSVWRTSQLYWVNTATAPVVTTFAATTTTAPTTTARVTTPTPPTTAAPVTPAATAVTTTNAATGASAVFRSAVTFDTSGLWRTVVRTTALILALPNLTPMVVDVAPVFTCDAVTPTLPLFTVWPPNGTAFNAGDVVTVRAIPNDVNSIAQLAKNLTTCSMTAYTSTTGTARQGPTLVALDSNGQYSASFTISSGLTAGWVTLSVSGFCDFGASNPSVYALLGNQSTMAVPATNYLFNFRPAAPTPRITVSATVETNQAAVGGSAPTYIFAPVRVRFASDAGTNQTTFVLVVPGDVLPAGVPAVKFFTAYTNLASPFPSGGVLVTSTSWVLAYTTAPLYTASALATQLITIETGTETWKYVLLSILVVGSWLVYVGFVVRDVILARMSVKRRRQLREEAKNTAPLEAVIFGRKEEWRVADSTDEPQNSKEARRWRRRRKEAQRRAQAAAAQSEALDDRRAADEAKSKFLARVAFLGFVINDVVLITINIAFAVTCFAFDSINVAYKILWTVTMIVLGFSLVARWLWGMSRFDPPSDADDDEEMFEGDADSKEISMSLQFAPLVNIVMSFYFIKRFHTVANTERSRAFWGGITRLFIDFPQLIMCGVFIGQNPTRTNDASLIQFYFSLACVIFGLQGAVNAAVVIGVQLYRFCRDEHRRRRDDDGEYDDEEGEGHEDGGDVVDENGRRRRQPDEEGEAARSLPPNDPHQEQQAVAAGPTQQQQQQQSALATGQQGAKRTLGSSGTLSTPRAASATATTDPFASAPQQQPYPMAAPVVVHRRSITGGSSSFPPSTPEVQPAAVVPQQLQQPLQQAAEVRPPPEKPVAAAAATASGAPPPTEEEEMQLMRDLETIMRLRVLRELGYVDGQHNGEGGGTVEALTSGGASDFASAPSPNSPKVVRFEASHLPPAILQLPNRQTADDDDTAYTVDFQQQAQLMSGGGESRGPSEAADATVDIDFDI